MYAIMLFKVNDRILKAFLLWFKNLIKRLDKLSVFLLPQVQLLIFSKVLDVCSKFNLI